MPLPFALTPLILALVKVGAGVAAGAAIARRGMAGPERVDTPTDEALDRLPRGLDIRLDGPSGRLDCEASLARSARLWPLGQGLAVDVASMTRLRVRRLGQSD